MIDNPLQGRSEHAAGHTNDAAGGCGVSSGGLAGSIEWVGLGPDDEMDPRQR
jgi:hypothetical protein